MELKLTDGPYVYMKLTDGPYVYMKLTDGPYVYMKLTDGPYVYMKLTDGPYVYMTYHLRQLLRRLIIMVGVHIHMIASRLYRDYRVKRTLYMYFIFIGTLPQEMKGPLCDIRLCLVSVSRQGRYLLSITLTPGQWTEHWQWTYMSY